MLGLDAIGLIRRAMLNLPRVGEAGSLREILGLREGSFLKVAPTQDNSERFAPAEIVILRGDFSEFPLEGNLPRSLETRVVPRASNPTDFLNIARSNSLALAGVSRPTSPNSSSGTTIAARRKKIRYSAIWLLLGIERNRKMRAPLHSF